MDVIIERWQDLQGLSEGFAKTSDHKTALQALSASEEALGRTCLIGMEDAFSSEGEKLFYQVFARAYWETCLKRKTNKARYWGLGSLLAGAAGVSGAGGVLLGGCLTLLNLLLSYLDEPVSGALVLQLITSIKRRWFLCFLIPAAFVTLWFSLACFKNALARRNYRETWVRNSVTHHRLLLAMVRFQSGIIGKDEFMRNVLEILEGNIGRFEYNMSMSGKAPSNTGREAANA